VRRYDIREHPSMCVRVCVCVCILSQQHAASRSSLTAYDIKAIASQGTIRASHSNVTASHSTIRASHSTMTASHSTAETITQHRQSITQHTMVFPTVQRALWVGIMATATVSFFPFVTKLFQFLCLYFIIYISLFVAFSVFVVINLVRIFCYAVAFDT
jgi:hypothetical protein